MIMLKPFKYVKKCFDKIFNMKNVSDNNDFDNSKKNDDIIPNSNIISNDERNTLLDNINNNNNNNEINENDICLHYPNVAWADTIPFVPPVKTGYVIKVYDGDTITIASKLPYDSSPLYRFSVRLNGIDTPEIKGKTDEEKTAAKRAQKALENIILNKNIILKNVATEKYGRILADVYLEDLHLNKWLIDNGYAVKYDGGKKQIYSEIKH